MAVTPSHIITFDDGEQVPPDVYGYFAPNNQMQVALNVAYPNPNQLASSFTTFTLTDELTLGGRHDRNAERHFQGKMAMIQVYDVALDAFQARCLFSIGDAYLPAPALEAFQRHKSTHNGRPIWCWDYTYRLADFRADVAAEAAGSWQEV